MRNPQRDPGRFSESELFRLLIENVKDYAVFVIDLDGCVQTWNAGAERLLGYTEAEILGQSAKTFFLPEDVQAGVPEQEMKGAAEHGRGNDDRWHVRKDGSHFWAGGMMTPLRDEQEQLIGYAKIMRDRTDWRRRTELAEKQSRIAKLSSEVSLAVVQTTSLPEMLRQCAEAIMQSFQGSAASIWTFNPAENMLELRALTGTSPCGEASFQRIALEKINSEKLNAGNQIAGKQSILKQSATQPNVTSSQLPGSEIAHQAIERMLASIAGNSQPAYFDGLSVRGFGGESEAGFTMAGVPLVVDQRVVGVSAVFADHALGQEALTSMATVASAIALGIERKAAEEGERRQREWLAVTLASIGDAVIATDTNGNVTFLNGVAQSLTGWTQEAARGQPLNLVFCAIDERTRAPVESPVASVIHEERVVGLGNHTVLVSRSGSEYPIDDRAAPIRDESGQLIGVVLVFRDVTEQRRAETEIRQSEARKSAIMQTALDCVITIDEKGRVVEFNPAAEATFGYSRSEVLGRELATLIIPPHLRDEHRKGMARYLATGEGPALGKRLELPAIRADGSELPVEVAITRIPTDGPPLFTAYLRDISERRRADEYRNARLAITHALNEATTMQAGISGVLQAVCEYVGWEAGLLWMVDTECNLIQCTDTWHNSIGGVASFAEASYGRAFPSGAGLPGRVWADAQPAWIIDLANDTNFLRLADAINVQLRSAFACPVTSGEHVLGVIEFFSKQRRTPDSNLLEMMGTVAGQIGQFIQRRRAEDNLREQTATAETLYRISGLLAQELDIHKLVQVVTDEATQICGAQFGAFFYNVISEQGESYTLYTLSGVPREAFANFPMPRSTDLFGPTFRGEGAIRLDDVTLNSRYGKNEPYFGMPKGHLPVKSYLAVPVIARSGEVLGGLFFGHAEAAVFTEWHERLVTSIAGQAAIAIDNARLYQSTQAVAERLNMTLSAADLGDWNWDASSDKLTFSARASAIFGIPADSPTTWSSMQELLHEEDRDRVRSEVERVVLHRVQYDIEYRIRRSDGTMAWVAVLGRAMYDESDKLVGMFGLAQDIGERKQLEENLRNSEARFRGLMEQAPFSIQVFRPDGQTVRVNRAWEELWGISLEDLANYNILQDPQLQAGGVGELLKKAFAGEAVRIPAVEYDRNQTVKSTYSEDSVRWVAAVAYPLKDPTGKVREVVLVHEDTTARRRAELALSESEEKLRLMADTIPQLAWMARPDGEIFWYNQRWYEYTGTTLEQMQGWGWQSVHDPRVLNEVIERWEQSLKTSSPFDMVFPIKGADGRFRPFLTRVNPLRDDQGDTLYWFGTNTDISEQQQAAETSRFLAEASATLAAVVDYKSTLGKVAQLAIPFFADWCAVEMADDTGMLNRLAIVHADPSKVALANDLYLNYPPRSTDAYGAPNVIRTGQPELAIEIEDEVILALAQDDEHLRILRELNLQSYICVPLIVRSRVLGAITFVMSESRRNYGAADLELAQDLAHRAAIAVDNSRLYQELRDADRRKDEFLATLAHELRNPLAPIRNSLQVLKMSHVEPQMAQQVRAMMERQVDHLVRLVDDLLDISRVMRGKIDLRRERVELASIVARAVEIAQPLVEVQGHTLDIALPPESLLLDADPVRLAQVVGNLLTNAAKYTDANGHIQLSARRSENMAILTVKDNGIGIAREMLPQVFELFVQVDHASTRAQGGLGIGLTLVKNLVEMHHGTVEAFSEGLGNGSEFVVRLPLVVQHGRSADDLESAHAMRDFESSNYRILVVDDNKDAATSLAMLLRLQGYQVEVAHDGVEGLALAAVFLPHIVFLDIGMPRMDGYEVARRIRKEPSLEHVVLTALTGWGQQEDRRRTAEAGFDHHLVKPPDPKALEEVLAKMKQR